MIHHRSGCVVPDNGAGMVPAASPDWSSSDAAERHDGLSYNLRPVSSHWINEEKITRSYEQIILNAVREQQSGRPGGGAAKLAAAQTQLTTDVEVLNYALTLEHLEATFYRDGLATIGQAGITGLGFQLGVFSRLGENGAHEADHVVTLTDVITHLGGTPVQEGAYDFGYADAAGFLQVAQALEDTGVAANTGAAQYLTENDELLTAALTIHGVDARHASYLAILNGAVPYPDAFNAPLTPS